MADTELVILVGLPGAGKTTFHRARFAATHVHVSKDLMPNRRDRQARQLALVDEALAAGRSVVVDNVNATVADRAALIAVGRRRRSEEHTSELQSQFHLVCRLLLEKKKKKQPTPVRTTI